MRTLLRAISGLVALAAVGLGLLCAADFHWLGGLAHPLEPARAAVFGPPRIDTDGWQASSVVEFSASELEELRAKARAAAPLPHDLIVEAAMNKELAGWRVSDRDPAAVVACFPTLRLDKSRALHAYEFIAGGDAWGKVFALPLEAPFPPVPAGEARHDPAFKMQPATALSDFMLAVELSGNDRSYLEASILRRELAEFSAAWHAVNWGMSRILDHDAIENSCQRQHRLPRGEGWAPRVERGKNRVRVVFKVGRGRYPSGYERVVDEYVIGSGRASTTSQPLASCGGGAMP